MSRSADLQVPADRCYRAVAQWDWTRMLWFVRLEDPVTEPPTRFGVVGPLGMVESEVRVLLSALLDELPTASLKLRLEVALSRRAEQVLAQLTSDLAGDDGAVIVALADALRASGVDPMDVVTVLEAKLAGDGDIVSTRNDLGPSHRRLLVLLRHMLLPGGRYGGISVMSCRACLRKDLDPWLEHPYGISILFYEAVHCDRCGRVVGGQPAASTARSRRSRSP